MLLQIHELKANVECINGSGGRRRGHSSKLRFRDNFHVGQPHCLQWLLPKVVDLLYNNNQYL